ncbi:MAG: hypothetical protein LBP31_00645 [Holosporales bacterium]|jgi:hypothetical protein|nr:hypothetical protein [Holosporales bacterium]
MAILVSIIGNGVSVCSYGSIHIEYAEILKKSKQSYNNNVDINNVDIENTINLKDAFDDLYSSENFIGNLLREWQDTGVILSNKKQEIRKYMQEYQIHFQPIYEMLMERADQSQIGQKDVKQRLALEIARKASYKG